MLKYRKRGKENCFYPPPPPPLIRFLEKAQRWAGSERWQRPNSSLWTLFSPRRPTQDLHRQVMNRGPLPTLGESLSLGAQLRSTQHIECAHVCVLWRHRSCFGYAYEKAICIVKKHPRVEALAWVGILAGTYPLWVFPTSPHYLSVPRILLQ